jgi:hypothetical protein
MHGNDKRKMRRRKVVGNKRIFLRLLVIILIVFSSVQSVGAAENVTLTSNTASKIGETLTVCGTVAGSNQAGKQETSPLYVNLDMPWPESPFLLVIGKPEIALFPVDQLKTGQPVCAAGMIESSPKSGKPYILLKQASQLRLVDLRVSAQEAVSFEGQYVTVYGKVASARFDPQSEKQRTYLNLESPYPLDPAVVVINFENRPYFVQPEKDLLGKMISVRGLIQKSAKGRALVQLIWPVQLTVEQ